MMTIYCITAQSRRALAATIIEKWEAGLIRRGKAIPVGGGNFVQRMIADRFIGQAGDETGIVKNLTPCPES